MAASAGSPAFEWVCKELVSKGVMSALEARGTVRLAVKNAGLNPATILKTPMSIVLTRVLKKQLELRNVRDAAKIVAEIASRLEGTEFVEAPSQESPEDIFARLGPNSTRR